tara:strand:- start:422 stop:1180 length:759 start_codon:yes stop_codon:yes gene_type:complete
MHFYKENGDPFHYVKMTSKEGLRPVTIRDVRRLWKDGTFVVPSVTTILNIYDKSGLNNWRIDQHLNQAYDLDKESLTIEEYKKEIKRLTAIQLDLAPSAGTDFHKLMEDFVSGNMKNNASDEDYMFCESVYQTILSETGSKNFKTETNFSSDLFGGQVDLHNDDWIIDYKTKQTADKFKPKKMIYIDHSMQLSAYRFGLNIPQAKCVNVFVCLEKNKPQIDFHIHDEEQLKKGGKLFSLATKVWHIKNPKES